MEYLIYSLTGAAIAAVAYYCGRYNQTKQYIINLKEAELYDRRKFYKEMVEAVKGITRMPNKV